MKYLTAPYKLVFKELTQDLVPVNMMDGKVLLIIDSSFLINEEPGQDSSPNQNTNIIMEHDIASSIIRMLEQKEKEMTFVNFENTYLLNTEKLKH